MEYNKLIELEHVSFPTEEYAKEQLEYIFKSLVDFTTTTGQTEYNARAVTINDLEITLQVEIKNK